MRLHVHLDDELVRELDRRAGPRGRSAWIVAAIRRSLEDERRWDEIESALGALGAEGGEWGSDTAAWVREGRRSDPRTIG